MGGNLYHHQSKQKTEADWVIARLNLVHGFRVWPMLLLFPQLVAEFLMVSHMGRGAGRGAIVSPGSGLGSGGEFVYQPGFAFNVGVPLVDFN